MKDWQFGLIIAAICAGVVIFFTVGIPAFDRRDCAKLSTAIGRDTRYVGGSCRVRVCDNVWLSRSEIVYQLDLIQSCEPPAPQEQAE